MGELIGQVTEEADEVRQPMVVEVDAMVVRVEAESGHHPARLTEDLAQDLVLLADVHQRAAKALLDLIPLLALSCHQAGHPEGSPR